MGQACYGLGESEPISTNISPTLHLSCHETSLGYVIINPHQLDHIETTTKPTINIGRLGRQPVLDDNRLG